MAKRRKRSNASTRAIMGTRTITKRPVEQPWGVYTIQANVLVVSYLSDRLRQTASEIIFTAAGVDLNAAACVVSKLTKCLLDLEECRPKIVVGPDCPKGSHEYMGVCVPDDPPDPNG